MKTLDRKLLRDLWRSKGLLLAIASIITVGVNNWVTLQSVFQNLNNAKRDYYRQCRMADFWIDVKKVPLAELDSLRALRGIEEITPRIQFKATVDLDDVFEPINAMVISMPNERRPVLNDVLSQRGDYFTDRRDNEVIVNEKFARSHNLHPGQTVHLLLNNRRQELFIVGTAISSEFVYSLGPGAMIPDPRRFGIFYIKQRFAEEIFDFEGAANQICGRLSVGRTAGVRTRAGDVTPGFGEDVLRRAETLLEPYGVFSATPLRFQASNQFTSNEIGALGAIATMSPSVFLTIAALVLNVLITRLARQQRIVIGTLKALGYTDWQLFAHFLRFGLVIGIAGGIVGCVCGFLLAGFATDMYRYFFEFPDLRGNFYWHTHLIGIVISMVCAIVGSLRGAHSVLRLQPAEAMRPEPPKRGGRIWLEGIKSLWSRLNASWRMVLRSVFRNRFRTITAIFATLTGTGILVHGFMLIEAQNHLIDFQFYRVSTSDIDLYLESERGEGVLAEVQSLPGVDYAEPFLQVACTLVHNHSQRKASITGLVPNARLTTPRDIELRRLELPETGIILGRRLAEVLQLSVGDHVTMIPVKGERRPVQVPVVKIADSYLGLTAYADLQYLSRLVGEGLTISGIQLQTNRSEITRRALYRELKQMPAIQAIQGRREMIDNLTRTLLESQKVLITLTVAFAGVAFFSSVLNASMVNLAERQREVATFVALGYTRWQVGNMFLKESAMTCLIGTSLGFPFGRFVMWLTSLAYNGDLMRLPVVSASWINYTTLLLAALFALSAHAIVQRSIHSVDFAGALNVKE